MTPARSTPAADAVDADHAASIAALSRQDLRLVGAGNHVDAFELLP